MTDWDAPQPYPEAPKGTRFRMLDMPVAAPERTRKPMTAKRKSDGTEVDIMKTLGMRPAGEVSPDELVTDWRPVA